MLVATCRYEDTHTEKQSLVPHASIVGEAKKETGECAWVIPGRKYRSAKSGNFNVSIPSESKRVEN